MSCDAKPLLLVIPVLWAAVACDGSVHDAKLLCVRSRAGPGAHGVRLPRADGARPVEVVGWPGGPGGPGSGPAGWQPFVTSAVLDPSPVEPVPPGAAFAVPARSVVTLVGAARGG